MPEPIEQLYVELSTDPRAFVRQVDQAVDKAGRRFEGLTQRIGREAAKWGKIAAAGAVAMAAGAVKIGADFEKVTSQTIGLTNLTVEEMEKVRQKLLALAPTLGKSPRELAEAFYFAASGIEGADKALAALEVSARASAAGMGDTMSVVQAVTSVMNAYNMAADQAARVTDVLTAAVKFGKFEPAELAGSLGRVIPLASQMGVTFEEVAASMATMSNIGMSASESATALNAALSVMLNPGKEARDILAQIGTSADELRGAIRERGLAQVLIELIAQFEGNDDALTAFIPNIRALRGILATAGGQAENYQRILGQVSDATGLLDEATEEAQRTFSFQWNRMVAAAQVAAVRFGTEVMPSIQRAVENVTPAVVALGDSLAPVADAIDILAKVLKPLGSSLGAVTAALLALGAALVAVQLATFITEVITMTVQFGVLKVAIATTTGMVTALKAALVTPIGLMLAFAAAIVVIDVAVKKLTGYNLIAWFTGAASAAKRNAALVREFGDAILYVNEAVREGLTPLEAHQRTLAVWASKAREAIDASQKLVESHPKLTAVFSDYSKELRRQADLFKFLAEQILALEPTWLELSYIMDRLPELAEHLNDRFEEQLDIARQLHPEVAALDQRFQKLARPVEVVSDELDRLAESAAAVLSELEGLGELTDSLATMILPAFEASLERINLERQITALEALKLSLGEAFSDEQQRALDVLTVRLDLMRLKAQEVDLRIKAVGARFLEAFGPEATERLQAVVDTLADFPAELVIDILPLLDVLSVQRIEAFMSYLRKGVSVPVAFALAERGIPEPFYNLMRAVIPDIERFLEPWGKARVGAIDVGIDVEKMTQSFVAAGAGAEAGAEDIETLLDVMLRLATAAGLTGGALADWPWILQMATRAAERLGLSGEDLEDTFRRSGEAFQKFARRLAASEALELLRDRMEATVAAMDDLRSAFARLFAQPSREEAQAEYQLAQLKLRRAQMAAAGATDEALAAIDEEIDRIEAINELRSLEAGVIRAQLDLADRTLQTEAARFRAAQDLVAQMADISAVVGPLVDLYGEQEDAMRAWMEQLDRVLGRVIEERLLPTEIMNFQHGGIVPGPRGQPHLAMVHGGEPILPAGTQLGMALTMNIPIDLTVQGGDWATARRAAHEAVEEALQQARSRSYRAGAPLGSAIG